MKNIKNNLLNKKKFVFPEFVYDGNLHIKTSCPAGYFLWGDLYVIFNKDKQLKSNLRKAPKLSYLALDPGNNKHNVPLAPNQRYVANFLEIFNTWWTISNSKKKFSPNKLGNAVNNGD